MTESRGVIAEGHLADYAVRSAGGGQREHVEAADPLRGPFELDRHRIIESTAFRRLEHKTQVFVAAHHDHFRTRLTHTLEVAQVARTLAVALRANEALAETIALAHDLGHPPFGHAGEVALEECMRGHGGFNHNTHALRVVEYLEHPFPAFRGLNLTRAVRAGLGAHESRYDVPEDGVESDDLVSVEAQVASVADRLAYNCHDLEDAIGAEFIGFGELAKLPLWVRAAEAVQTVSADSPIYAVRRLVLDQLANLVLMDVVATARKCLMRGTSGGAAASWKDNAVRPSEEMEVELRRMEEFLVEHVYRHAEVKAMDARGQEMVRGLFAAYRVNPEKMPARFVNRVGEQGVERVVCDYISGMTDRYCKAEFERMVEAGSGC